ncbi:MAG: FAD-binding oxidoreductase [Planctomycetes bacterium]|nr:FAD-binding oxidoreductase [Planctomycetota bacterium]
MSDDGTLIIGGGIAGAATAWHLARRGAEGVVLLERERDFGAHATAQNAAILRTFTEGDATGALAHETATFLMDPPDGFSEVPLLDPKGLILQLGASGDEELARWRATKPDPDAVRPLDAAELQERFPWYSGPTEGAWLVEDEGEIDVAALLEGYLRGAREAGCELRAGAEVARFIKTTNGIEGVVLSDGEELRASKVIVCAGGWAGDLAREAGSTLSFEPRRRHLMVTSADEAVDAAWPIFWSQPEAFYTRPESGGMLLCACDEEVVAPDECTVDHEVGERIAEKAARLVEGVMNAGCAHLWAGMRTFTSDDDFLIGPDPDVDGLYWAAALGGHGVSCSAGVGRLAAEHILGEDPSDDTARALDPRRSQVTQLS